VPEELNFRDIPDTTHESANFLILTVLLGQGYHLNTSMNRKFDPPPKLWFEMLIPKNEIREENCIMELGELTPL